MSCQHDVPLGTSESAFSVEATPITFGRGALDEAGAHAASLGCRRVALFTDTVVGKLEHVARVVSSLERAGVGVTVYDAVKVEPTDHSFQDAARFARDGRFDGYVSVGGGSVLDTCKASALYATWPADFLHYVNKPVGAGEPVPGPLPPHIACPTTSGTGSECTGIAVFDLLSLKAKTGIASRRLRPTLALIDPRCTETLPGPVVAASGFDVLSHALESYTARPYTARLRPETPQLRPMSQGANPWSDVGSLEALRLCGRFLVRAVRDPADLEAREQMMFAATLAGIAFGNAGVHLPHAMAYAVAGLVRDFRMPGYPPEESLVPHGVSVIVNAPAVFRVTARVDPQRHLTASAALGADISRANPEDAGELLAATVIDMMRQTAIPNGLSGVGYGPGDIAQLTAGTVVQKRLLDNAPLTSDGDLLASLFRSGMSYW
jgi:alcohol dehydrogenase class IV